MAENFAKYCMRHILNFRKIIFLLLILIEDVMFCISYTLAYKFQNL